MRVTNEVSIKMKKTKNNIIEVGESDEVEEETTRIK